MTTPASAPAASHIPLERLFASPGLSGPSPREVKYAPDGKRVTFLKAREEDTSRFDLWAFDVATGEASMLVDSMLLEPDDVELSEEEKAIRERKRIAGSKGIVAYDWGDETQVLVPLGGDLYLVTLGESDPDVRQLTETDAFEYDAKVSPGGDYVSFVRDGAVYAIDLETGEEQRLTPLAEPEKAISYGVAEFVAQEEMSRYTGYWWSPDDRYVVYTRVDESTVDIIPRFEIAAGDVTVIDQRYPRAGRPNAVVDLFVRDMDSGAVHEITWRREDWGPATDQYLARVDWTYLIDGIGITVQRVDRDQTTIDYGFAAFSKDEPNPQRITLETEHAETQANWVNLSYDYRALPSAAEVYTSETSGVRQVYYRQPGDEAAAITGDDWVVDGVKTVDEANGTAYVTGFHDTPLENHLYAVSLGGGEPTRITEPGKSWSVTVAPDGQTFVGTSSAPNHPPQTGLYQIDGTLITWIEENALDETHPYAPYLASHTVPEFGTITAEDGQEMYYSFQLPPDFDENKTYPVILEVYGGPGVQRVTRNWENPIDQFYVQNGYILFRLDNRGSANRGKAFEDVIYRKLGQPEVGDQLKGVEFLKSLPYVDGDRIAIHGWSYGGYMTLMVGLQVPPGTFAAAISGAPVSDWALYDTFYTERYMDTPQDNPEGYEQGSVFPHLENLSFPLLMIHGMADDNVTFDNSTRVYAELQEMGKPFEMMTYPGQRHGIRGEPLSVHLMKTRMAFLNRHLKGSTDAE